MSAAAAPPRVVMLDSGSFTVAVSRPVIEAPHRWREYDRTPAERVVERLAGATVAITNAVALPREVLAQLPDLRLISACSTGLDYIDLAYCDDRGIAVRNATDYATDAVAEHVFGLILALRRNLELYVRDMRDGAWRRSGQYSLVSHPIAELRGARLGIVGGGAIGRAVARIGEGFGMETAVAARKGMGASHDGRPAFETVLESSDVISLHCPLATATRDLIGRPEFRLMKRRPLLINTARGGIVNEAALVEALHGGLIAGAGFDVATSEPIAVDNPLLALTGDPRFILTPHVAWASREAQQSLMNQAVGNVDDFLRYHAANRDHSC